MLSRRESMRFVATSISTSLPFLLLPASTEPAHAAVRARGAAELDFEYYMRDLVGGNQREGTVQASTPPPVPPPRTLQQQPGPLLPLLLNNDCSPSCIPVQALIQQLQKPSTKTSKSASAVAQEIQASVAAIREKTYKSFYSKAPWQKEDVSDQYYFDFTAYALWKTAASLLPNNVDRDQFARLVGKLLLKELLEKKLVTVPASPNGNALTLVESTETIQEVLKLFQLSGYCKEIRIRTTDDVITENNSNIKAKSTPPIFDELDDDSIAIGSNVDCLVSIIEPASLGASLQINGEQSRFGPDFVGSTLAAILEKYAGISSSWEVFFVDAEYRPNPKDYFPNEQLLQFTLTKKKS